LPGEGLRIDDPCDAVRLGLTVGGPAPVHHVDAAVSAPGVAGAHGAEALTLKPVRKPRDLEPVTRISIQIDE
jgi:hypothetical protein